MGIITDTLGIIDAAVGTIARQGFEAGAGAIGNTISVSAALILALMGINAALQIAPITLASFMAFGVRLSLIMMFALSWGNFSFIFAILTDLPQSVGNALLGLTDIGDEGGLYASLDKMLSRVTEYGDAIGDNAGWVFGAVLGVVFYLIAAIFAAVGAGIIAYASVMLTVMVVVAPYAIFCSLFGSTKSIFEAWSRSTIGYAVMPIITGIMLGVIASAGELVMDAAALPDAVTEIGLILSFLTIMLLSVGMMAAIPAVSQNVSGAFGLASNAMGLTGLAQRGMERGTTAITHSAAAVLGAGAGAATRFATGHSPAEIGHAARHGASDALRQRSVSGGYDTFRNVIDAHKEWRDERSRPVKGPELTEETSDKTSADGRSS